MKVEVLVESRHGELLDISESEVALTETAMSISTQESRRSQMADAVEGLPYPSVREMPVGEAFYVPDHKVEWHRHRWIRVRAADDAQKAALRAAHAT